MKKLHFTFVLISAFCGSLFAQHPNIFLKDVYNLEWCQTSKIKTLKSGGGTYTMMNGVPISEKVKDITNQRKGRFIRQVIGKNSFIVSASLSSDLKRLQRTSSGPITTFYHYDKNEKLSYKVNTAHLKPSQLKYVNAFSLEEMSRDSNGLLIKKEIYNYREDLTSMRQNLYEMQCMDRIRASRWNYKYNENNELIEITILHYSTEERNEKHGTSVVKIEHEDSLPVSMTIKSTGKTPPTFGSQRKFSYTF